MLKKMITMLGCIGLSAIASSNVISCIAPKYADGIDGQRIVLTTDGSVVNDRSFNQNAMDGISEFLKDVYNLGSSNSYVESGSRDPQAVISAYKLAVLKKANVLVVPGFPHLQTLPQSLSFLQKQNIIFVDAEIDAPNVINLLFNSQIAGLKAGFDTCYWATTINPQTGKVNGDINNDGNITIGTFAGGSNKFSTDNYVWGLMLGISVFNDLASDINRNQVYFANSSTKKIDDFKVNSPSDSALYTNSFSLGGAVQSGMLSKLIDINKSDIIFPVAGAQIEDVVNYKTPVYLIGVDVDQANSYPMAGKDGKFVTSAIKNISQAVQASLPRAEMSYKTAKEYGLSTPRKNTLVDPSTNTNFEIGKGLDSNMTDNDKWLGTAPEPLLNWSIDYTKQDNPNYLLDKSHLELFTGNGNTIASKDSAVDLINNYYRNLGNDNKSYMLGSNIVSFSKVLIEKFGKNIDSNGVLNWVK